MKKLPIETAVKRLRERRGWTQEELAREIGITVYTVHRWETRKTKPTKLAFRILKALLDEEGIDVEKR